MKIIEALNEICEKQIPKEINGVRTKFIIHERKISDYPEASELLVTILPKDVRKDNIGTTRNYRDMYYITYDFERATLGYKHLERDIAELLCLYTANVISRFQGKVIETRVIDTDIAMISDMRKENDELKRLLKEAVNEMAQLGEQCSDNAIHCCNCPFEECGKFSFHDEIMELIGGEGG